MKGVSISAYFFENKPDKLGRCPISIRLNINKTRSYVATGFKVLPKQWDEVDKQVRKSHPNHALINAAINKRLSDFESSILKREISDKLITVSKVKQQIKRGKGTGSFFKFTEDLLKDLRRKHAAGTMVIYEIELAKFKEFLGADIAFNDIDTTLLRKYETFLIDKGLSNNTIHKSWKILRRVMNIAINEGLTDNYPFRQYDNPTYKQTDRIHLSFAEVDKIEKMLTKKIPDNLRVAANYFLLGCYSGLRFSDWLRFEYEKFVQGNSLYLRTQKNKEIVSINMHHRLKATVDRIKDLPSIYSMQKTNVFLKEIARRSGIKKVLTSHVARHTFAVGNAELGISIETTADLMAISIESCKVYYKVTNRKINKEFAAWNDLPAVKNAKK